MAVNIVKKPFAVEFIQNDLSFVFKGDNIQTAGTFGSTILIFNTQPQHGDTLTLNFRGRYYNYTFVSTTPTNYSIYVLLLKNNKIDDADLLKKLNENYYLSKYLTFSISYFENTMRVIFTSKHTGMQSISFSKTGTFDIFQNIQIAFPRTYRKDYKVWVRFNFEYIKSGNKITEQSPEILLDVDNDGCASLPLDILKNLTKEVDIPSILSIYNTISKYSATILNRALIKFSIEYSEMYDGDIKRIRKSEEFYGINGVNSTSGSDLNLPDWIDIFPDPKIEKYPLVRLFGCDNNGTYQSHLHGRDYLYLCLFDKTKDKNHSKTIKCKLEILLKDGTITEHNVATAYDLTIKNYSIVRVPVYLQAFVNLTNIEKILQYKIIL